MDLTPKQKNNKKRFDYLIDTAEGIIRKKGIDFLTFDLMAEETGYSRSTIFNVFKSKDRLITNLALKAYGFWVDQSKKAATYDGSTRDKLAALYVATSVTCNLYASSVQAIIYINNPYFNIEDEYLLELIAMRKKLINIYEKLIESAINKGDIHIVKETPFDIATSIFLLNYGALSLRNSKIAAIQQNVNTAESYIRFIANLINWHPTSEQIDYKKLLPEITNALFNLEIAQLGTNKPNLI